jgi:two-component system phosphate regulon sensor histidine kinase PhoR
MQWNSLLSVAWKRLLRPRGRLAVVLYVTVIATPAVILVWLGFTALQKQRLALGLLTSANLTLAGEKLSADIERQTFMAAEECLNQAAVLRIVKPVHDSMSLMEAHSVRQAFERAYPPDCGLVEEFFVLEDGHVLYPLLKAPMIVRVTANKPTTNATEQRSVGHDLPKELSNALATNSLARLRSAWREVAAGKWELTVEQLDWVARRTHERAGALQPSDTAFTRHFAVAQLLEEHARAFGRVQSGHAYPLAFPSASAQLFYTRVPAPKGHERIMMVLINNAAAADTIFKSAPIRTGVSQHANLVAKGRADGVAQVKLPIVFPFWRIAMSEDVIPRPAYADWLFPMAMAVVIGLLGMGILLLVRDHLRQSHLADLRAAFVGGVSHEFRTPLTAIRMYADMLRYKDSFTGGERRAFYEIIAAETGRLDQLVDRVLNVSRIDRGERLYQFSSEDLGGTVSQMIDSYKEYCLAKGYDLKVQLASEIPPVLHDPDAVSQAVLNLLDNAVKFSGTSKRIEVALRATTESVVLEVRDYGIGIAESEQKRIFDEFYRAAGAAHTGGCGIGLYLVRHVMIAHQGRVAVESRPGQGSTFRIEFPRCLNS